ncbi:hypothetical protein [Halopiger djelfimassiliensis]|uniref:hypothetical protein n=1 Tax=Halopiger djelfimassiliensis TaxID=1293047 RepID=UPI000677EE05|nr:hypothetical protein [Halopiger djelfimassiliensis]
MESTALQTDQADKHVLIDRGEWDWTLSVEDGELTASKAIPHDGVLRYTTRDEHYSRRQNSEGGLPTSEVVDLLVEDGIPRARLETALEFARAAGEL